MVYDSYKHHSKYPFDNYRINVLQWGGGVIYLWYSILTRVNILYHRNVTPPPKKNWLVLPSRHFSVKFV